jgi:hypothetical protein
MLLAKLTRMSDREVRQVSLQLLLRGDPPFLHAIHFSSPPDKDKAADLQNRALPRAAATALLLFSAHRDLKLFRIRTHQLNGSLVHTILNAKNQPQGKSCIRDLANGAFLKLFLKPSAPESRYLDIDVNRLSPTAIEVTHDCRIVDDPALLRSLASQIAAAAGWNLDDYPLEIVPKEQDIVCRTSHSAVPNATSVEDPLRKAALDNPALAAMREAIRHFCDDGTHQHLRVGHVRSLGELEDLWAIDNEAYGEASITYERFKDWWLSFPLGLNALFFRNRVMGAIGIWPLSARCAGFLTTAQLKESEISGRRMRAFHDAPTRFWYISGIVLRPELIGGRAIRILLSRGVASWLSSANIQFPSELLALGYSEQGQALLEGFNFFKIRNATDMPDGVPLFGLRLETKQEFISSLKGRGLQIE